MRLQSAAAQAYAASLKCTVLVQVLKRLSDARTELEAAKDQP